MKKLVLPLSLVLCLLSATSYAQDIDFGIKAGANFASVRSSVETGDYSSIPGLHAGFFLSLSATDKFELQPEILYSSQGNDFKNEIGNVFENRAAYVNIPILAKIFIVQKLNIQVGPQFGLLLSANTTANGVENDVKDQLKNSSFDAVIGVGYDLLDKIDFALRYNLGVSDINDAAGVQEEIRNSVLQFSLGVAF